MLDVAYKYEEEIKNKMLNIWYDERYMFYFSSSGRHFWSNPDNDGEYDNRHFVSLNSNGEVIGLIDYHIDHECNMATWFGAINFTDNKAVFSKDLAQVIDDIFCKFNMRKLEFAVICGNPIEKNYDKLVAKYGGVITGIKRQHVRLMDGNYYDHKDYEIFREDYLAAKEKMKNGKQ
jgi:hypothetical protein